MELAGRRVARAPITVFALALFAGLAVWLFVWGSQDFVDTRSDPYSYSQMGKALARGEGLSAYGMFLHRHVPLYPFLIGSIYFVFGEHEFIVKIFQAGLHATTALLAFDLGRRIYNERTGWVAGLLCAFHPAFLRYVADFHVETLLTFLMTLTVWRSQRFVENPSFKNGVWFGAAAGIATLSKSVAVLYPPLFGLIWWLKQRRQPREVGKPLLSFLKVVVIGVALTLVISPWAIRNFVVSGGAFVPLGTGASDAFLRGFVFSKTEYITLRVPPYSGAENEVNQMFTEICAKEGVVWERDDLETERVLNRAATAKLKAEPMALVRKFAVGIFTFWYQMTSLTTSLAAGLMALVAWILAFVGFGRARREGRPQWLLLAPVLYMNVLLAVLLSLGRYSVPVLPELMVLAAFGIDTLLARWVPKRASLIDRAS